MVMLNDEREHVWTKNDRENRAVLGAWASVIKKKLKNIDGSAPELILGSEIVHDIRSARKVGEELARANCKQVIMCYNVWNFPFLVWPFVNSLGSDTPVLSLSNNNGKYPGNVGLLATDGALRQTGRRTHRIIGEVKDEATQAKVIDWLRASQAVTTIKNEVYGMYGGHSMGMETGYFHLTATIKALGCTCRQIDQLWLVKAMEHVDEKQVEKGLKWLEKNCAAVKYDGKMLTPETLKTQLRLYLAMELVNKDKGFDFCGLKGQRELTEYVCLGDVPEMLMNDPYDWRGRKEPMVCSTEADSNAAITMQLLKYITGGLPSLFMDVRLYHPDRDLWDWCNSGNHASWYAAQSFNAKDNLKHITLWPALEFYFKAGGASVEFDAAPGPMTFCRLGMWDEKPYMVIVRGESVKLAADLSKQLADQTNPTWPHVWAKLDCTFDEFTNVFPCNHVQGIPGDRVRRLVYLCEIAGVKPIVLGQSAAEFQTPIWERV
jgi:L-fucose isomerase